MVRRFSETAFQRGTLSGAVLGGTGKMMLFSCLKKTVGQSQPDKWQQRKLFQEGSPTRNVPGGGPGKVKFNRGFTDSAVGLVVDTLRDARRTVEDMQNLALGKSEMGREGAGTLRTMYPFLDDSRERELLAQYRQQLNAPEGTSPQERGALQNAIVRMEALIAKKAQMKQEFINKLRFLSDRASEALADFTQPGFTGELDLALRLAFGAGEPPPEDEKGTGDGAAEPGEDPPGGGKTGPPGTEEPDPVPGSAVERRADGPGGSGGDPSL